MTVQYYQREFADFSRRWTGRDPAWLAPLRRSAIDRFAARGFPTPRDENWHFTSVAPIAELEFQSLDSAGGLVDPSAVAPFAFGEDGSSQLVFINGHHAPSLSTRGAARSGVRVLDLASAMREVPDLLQRWLTTLALTEGEAFTALNTAFFRDGAIVCLPANMELSEPIHLLFIADASAAKGVSHPRNLIVAGRNSRATVVESYVSLTEATYFTNAVTEVAVEEGATLRHYRIQRESGRAFHVGTTQVHQARDSHYLSFSFATGAALSRTNIYTMLDGEGAGATLDGLYMGADEQHIDHQTRIDHAQPNCFSREVYKGILDGSSHGVFNGKVLVRPIAQKTDGKQSNNNLLLSDRARVDTKPQLEIFADDVKCTHGATVGRLDELALFYMKSRGIPADTARTLLTFAFAADVLQQIESVPVREMLERLTRERFTGSATEEPVSAPAASR
ncbi:MAG: Fe-S cluster assembly protein SufD [Gemmatimonadota bacterium]|nr:Fe-S cluster assembly protein SufD [Gemmatimonadota bacterium]